MAFALIMMLVAALFISGTASLMTNRAHQSGYMDLIMKRRIALENSKYFNQQMMLEKTFVTSSSMTGNQPGEFADGWGGLNTADGWAEHAHLPIVAPTRCAHHRLPIQLHWTPPLGHLPECRALSPPLESRWLRRRVLRLLISEDLRPVGRR
jgi:hypothetical protein